MHGAEALVYNILTYDWQAQEGRELGLAQALQTSIKITTPNPFNSFKEFHFRVTKH